METTLQNSYELIKEIEALEINSELKSEIDLYIKTNLEDSKGFNKRFSNIMFRGNLSYIISNIKKGTLIVELKAVNKTI